MSEIRIHPAAEAYRLMTEDELASLAEDIKANGLHDPIIIGRVNGAASDAIADGRNRERACEKAGIEPRYETRQFKDEDELIAFIKSRSERRDLTKGQRAIGLAFLYPEPEKGGRGKKSKAINSAETAGFSSRRLNEARTVLRHSRELALAVRDGTMALDEALEIVKKAKQAIESDETQIARLRREAPDLADLVEEGRMKAGEAITLLNERIADLDRKRRSATQLLSSFVYSWHPRHTTPADYAERMTENVIPKYWPDDGQIPLTKRNIELAAEVFAAIAAMAEKWENKK
jgi:ParB-like chromosome segregation protein Spo0J